MMSVCLTGSRSGVVARVVLAAVVAAGSGACIVRGDDGADEGYELRGPVESSGHGHRRQTPWWGSASRPAPTCRRCGVTRDGSDVTGAFRPAAAGGHRRSSRRTLRHGGAGAGNRRRHVAGHPGAGGPSARGAGLLRPARAALHLRDRPLRAGVGRDARACARRRVLRRPPGRLRLPLDRGRRAEATGRSARPPGGPGRDHDAECCGGALHRPDRDRHDQPRDLPDCDAARSGDRRRARSVDAAGRLERPADLHLRRRLRAGLVPAGGRARAG